METVVTDLAKPYIEKLINGAISESRLLFCLPRIEKEYEEERDRLEVERTTVRQHANVATGRGDEIQANVRRWVEDVDELIGEDDNSKTKHKYFCGICPNCIWRYKKGKELANKTEQIKILIEKREKLEKVGVSSQLPGIERYSSQNYISFESRESKYKELLDALKDDSNYIIGMQGMGGTGKTTLAKEVGKELKQFEFFSKVIVTIVSCTPDIKKIQNDIAGPLGLKLEESDNESDRSGKLWKRLTNGEKILLILDDVWDGDSPLDFEAIGIPKQDKHEGCKLLVTTRTKQVLIKMDYNKMIELDLLSEEEAWIMFKRYAGISNKGTSKSLIEKGGKIAEECKRLPVAISVIASSLKGQHDRPHVWNATLKSLKNHVSIQGDDEERVGIYKYLKPSYDNMRDERARGLFLLCSLFREDEEIDVELLIRLGIGVGLCGEEYGRYNDARDKVVMTIDKLLDSCLLLKAGKGCVKMHDLVRTAARWMKKEEIRAVHMSHEVPNLLVEKENNTTTKYMLCEGKAMDMFYSRFGGSNLEILITRFDKGRYADYVPVNVPNSTFENIARLRALVIQNECNYRALLPLSLPDSIQSLTNIRSLILDKVDLGDISVFGNLQSLETLDLCDCAINELPPEIAKLKKLKVLGLIRCSITRNNPFQVIRECSSLEQLDFNENFNRFCQEIVFPKLQGYYIHMNLESDIMNQYESTLRCIIFGGAGDVGFFSEATFKYCMETTEILCLEGIKWEWRNLIPEIVPIDKGMNDLIHLRLRDISQLQYLIDFENSNLSNVMSKLVVLELYEMQNLEELCTGDLSVESLKSLEKLKIKECNYLQSLFKYKVNLCNLKIMKLVKCPMLVSLSTYRSLVLLEEMVIKDCEQLKSIIINDDERREEDELGEVVVVDRDNKNKSHGSMFQKLKLLFIRGCPLLECILPFLVEHDLPVLETIKIERCQGLKYIFGKEVKLGSLQTLILIELPNFIDMFPECCLPMSSSKKASRSTSRDCSMPQTKSHPIIYNSFSWAHICCYVKKTKRKLKTITSAKSQDQLHDCSVALESRSYRLHTWEISQYLPIHILCNITKIKLSHFSKIKSVFILSIASRLMMLESLTIMECHELKHVIIDTGEDNSGKNWANLFPKLKELHVENCGQLEYIFGDNAVDYQNDSQIQLHLSVLKDLKLCKLPSLVAMCPKSYLTTFPSLSEVVLNECSQFAVNTDFVSHSIPDAIDNTTIKESNSYLLHSWERAQCLLIQPHIMCNITRIKLSHLSKIKSVFILFVASRLKMLESLTIMECHELKHIIIETGEDNSGNNWANVFPKLEELRVENCEKLEYIFGHSALHYQNDSQIQIHLPVLNSLQLNDLPSLVAVCPKTYITTFPSLAILKLSQCSQVPINSIGDLVGHSIPESIDNTTIKEWSGDVDYFCALKRLWISNIQVENVFCLNEKCEEKVNLGLKYIQLYDLPVMKYIFVGPINDVTLQNLWKIDIMGCDKLDIIFTTCVIRCLPQLYSLSIEECKELKHIIEEDAVEGQKIPTSHSLKTCFPKLELLRILKCNKLKYVFPVSICKRLPELQTLIIREAHELEEIFTSTEGDYKIEIPNLKVVAFEDLPSIWQGQGIQFQAVENRLFRNCPKLSQTSASTQSLYRHAGIMGHAVFFELCDLVQKIREDSEKQDTGGENPSVESNIATIEEEDDDKLVFSPGLKEIDDKSIQEDAASEKTTTSKQKDDGNGQKAMPSFDVLAKEDIDVRGTQKSIDTYDQEPKPFLSIPSAHASESPSIPSEDTIVAAEDEEVSENKLISSQIQNEKIQEAEHELVAVLEIPSMENLPTTSKVSLNDQSMDQQCLVRETDTTVPASQEIHNIVLKEIEDQSIQEDAASEQIITSKQKDDDNGQKVRGTQKSIETRDQVSLNDGIAVKKSLVIEDQLSICEDHEIRVLELKPSVSIPSAAVVSQSPSIPSKGNPSQIVEDLSSSSLIIRELQQLVFNKQLASENISLLTDFLVKHPSVRLTNNSLTNKYRGYAYNCLAELLKFLQTHSVLDVLSSNHSEFVELLQDTRSFAFDKEWLDGVERRVLFHGLQVSQDQDALQKLVHSKQQVTKKVEMLRLKIDIFSQQLEDLKLQLKSSEATLKSINKQEEQVLEARVALSTPIGY